MKITNTNVRVTGPLSFYKKVEGDTVTYLAKLENVELSVVQTPERLFSTLGVVNESHLGSLPEGMEPAHAQGFLDAYSECSQVSAHNPFMTLLLMAITEMMNNPELVKEGNLPCPCPNCVARRAANSLGTNITGKGGEA